MPEPYRPSWRLLALSTVLATAAAAGTYAVLSDDAERDEGGAIQLTPADDAPSADAAVFETYDGEVVALRTLYGTPLVVNFFASTCVPCIKEMPDFEEVHQELGDKVGFLGLAVADRPADAQALVERTGVTYQTAMDKDSSVITALGGSILPTTVLIDAEGTIVARHNGALDAGKLRALVAAELGVSP